MSSTAEVDVLVHELVILAARNTAGEHLFLKKLRKLEELIELYSGTFPQYVAWKFQMRLSTAHEKVRVARALETLPRISEQFESGRLSYSKVRSIVAVATPDTDATYAHLATQGNVRYVESVVRYHGKIVHAHDIERRRAFSVTVDEEGMFVVRGRLAPDEGALLVKALNSARAAGAANNCEAIAQVATAAVEQLATGADAVMHVQHDEHICAVEGHACARETAERLLCNQNANGRTISDPQRRALMQVQGAKCAFPDCFHHRWLDGHHLVPWSVGGKTELANLVLICPQHHRQLHEGQCSVTREGKELVFRNRHGVVLDEQNVMHAVDSRDVDLVPLLDIDIDEERVGDANTFTREDLDFILACLCEQQQRADSARAEPQTSPPEVGCARR